MNSAGGEVEARQWMALGAGLVAPLIGLCYLEGTSRVLWSRKQAPPVPQS